MNGELREGPAAPPEPPRSVALIRVGAVWDHRQSFGEQPLLQEHVAYVRQLARDGTVIMSGTVLEPGDRPGRDGVIGAVVYAAEPERARELANRCPAAMAGLVKAEILPWLMYPPA